MMVTPFHYRFYKCVQIFITIERIVKIFIFWANGPLKFPSFSPSIYNLVQCFSCYLFLRTSYNKAIPFKSRLLQFFETSVTLEEPLIHSFLTLCIFVTTDIHLSIFISSTSNLLSSVFLTGAVSNPYIEAGRTSVLCFLPLNLTGTVLSHTTPVIFIQLFQLLWALCSNSLSFLPDYCVMEPGNLKLVTIFKLLPFS